MKNLIKNDHPGIQFAIFIGIAFLLFAVNTFITFHFFSTVVNALSAQGSTISREAIIQFKWSQFIGAILTFIIPSLLYGFLFDRRPFQYLGFKSNVKLSIFIIVILLLIIIEPFAIYLGQLNSKVNFGELQEAIKKTEAFYEKAMSNFLRMDTPTDFVVNLIIVGLLPAIGEELFFRGSLQNILERWTKTPILAIILSSLAFAFLHGTAFKFLPIFVMGIVLGTIFYVTRNLWYNILFHFLNNSLALVATYYSTRSEMLKKISGDDIKVNLTAAAISLVLTIVLIYFMRKKSPYQPLPAPIREDQTAKLWDQQ